jgi:ABC-type transport system substrate-binding protein
MRGKSSNSRKQTRCPRTGARSFRPAPNATVTRGNGPAYDPAGNLPQGHQNSAAWAPPAVDGLLKAALGATTTAARFTAYAQITKTIQADLPYIGLYQEGVSVGISGKFTVPGYASNPPLSALSDYALYIKAAR